MEPANRRYAKPPGNLLPTARGLPLTLIGYWEDAPAGDAVGRWELVLAIGGLDAWRGRRGRSDYEPEWPIVTDFVDEHWDETERDRVASHLQEGLVA